MAEHRLIAAYRAGLLARLPAHLTEEVSGGLNDAFEVYLSQGLDPDGAARAAIAEFGSPGQVAAAFRAVSPARSMALALIVTGPVVGGCWAAALIAGHMWEWHLPILLPVTMALILAASVTLLATAAVTSRYQALRRAGLAGSLGLVALDASVTTSALLLAPRLGWLVVTAACMSTARLTFVISRMHRLVCRPFT